MTPRKKSAKAPRRRVGRKKAANKKRAAAIRPITPLSKEHIRVLFAQLPTRSATGLRNRALLALLYGGALRSAEALGVRPVNFDRESSTIKIPAEIGKGGKGRVAILLPEMAEHVRRWLDSEQRRALLKGTHNQAELPIIHTIRKGKVGGGGLEQCSKNATTKPSAMDTSQIRTWLARLSKRAQKAEPELFAGVRIHAHGLRHSFACEAFRTAGWSLDRIQEQLGHTSIAVTSHYLKSLVSTLDADELGWSVEPDGVASRVAESAEDKLIMGLENQLSAIAEQLAQLKLSRALTLPDDNS